MHRDLPSEKNCTKAKYILKLKKVVVVSAGCDTKSGSWGWNTYKKCSHKCARGNICVHLKAQLKSSVWVHVDQDPQAIVAKSEVCVDGDDQVFTKVFAPQSLTQQQSRTVKPQRQRYESGRQSGRRCWRQQLPTAARLMK